MRLKYRVEFVLRAVVCVEVACVYMVKISMWWAKCVRHKVLGLLVEMT